MRLHFALSSILALASISSAIAQVPTDKEFSNSLGMKLVRIEAGEFQMGEGSAPPKTKDEWLERDEDESPAHRVKISRSFYLGAFEVTNAQYEQFDPAHKAWRKKPRAGSGDDDPVAYVTWKQAVDFCAWLSKKEGKPYRLPTEAEWEYACRAGTTTKFNTGDTLTHAQANIGVGKDGKPRSEPMRVGSYPANAWGLHDMHGNVAEWCSDWYGAYDASDAVDPVGRIDGVARVVRGWSMLAPSYAKAERFARSANRAGHLPVDANCYTGFRVVLGEAPATKALPMAELPLHQQNVKATVPPKEGPDRKKPYFVDYAATKANPTIPPNTWGPIFSGHQHFSSVCVCPNGDVLAVWYTCNGESDRQLAQAASRLRVGSDKWEPASLFFAVPDVNCHAPVIVSDGKRIYHFATQSLHGWDFSSNIVRYSDDSGATWSAPQIMLARDEPNRLSQPCSALVAKDGTIVVACDGDGHRDVKLLLSGDRGKTWKVAKGDLLKSAGGKYVQHPAIVERADGGILCFQRGAHPMPVQLSKDLGDTWETADSPFPGIGVGQKAQALRLANGGIVLFTVDSKKELVGGGSLLALSFDDGKTWPHIRKVDAPVGGYKSLAEAPNGVIYLIGSQMRFAACNEAWIKEGKPLPTK